MADVTKTLKRLIDSNEPVNSPKRILLKFSNICKHIQQIYYEKHKSNDIEIFKRLDEDASEETPPQNLTTERFDKARQLPTDAHFSLFLPKHQEMAAEVIDALMSVPEDQLEGFLSAGAGQLNPELLHYCCSVALLHRFRHDLSNVMLRRIAETFPSKFLNSEVIAHVGEEAATVTREAARTPIIIPRDFTSDSENRLAYFREDIGVNSHHWHWHLVFPFTASSRTMVAKDRRGELFFYMHQQVLARYNGERLNNSLKRVKKFHNWREPILEAYFPKLDSLTSSRCWPSRQAGMCWQNLNRPEDGLNVTLDQMDEWRSRLEEAVATGQVILPDGQFQPLDIDTLGNMLEASILSPNREYYGSVHNNGHNFAAYVHDPENRHSESFSPIADEATTMRDPFFFRWHAWIDDFFQLHKESDAVKRYTSAELENPGVQVTSAAIESDGGQRNTLNTFWMLSDVDLSRGLDFSNRGPVYARFTHLNHRPFRYVINVNNTGAARRTTVRIFIAPKNDERNLPWNFNDHRKMFVEMDRFVVPLNAGNNTITRQSTQSSVTIPFEQTFRDLSVQADDPRRQDLATFNFCGCGWPQHMLVPKGTEAGAAYQLFVMLSNYDQDRVNQPDGSDLSCDQLSSFCGLKDRLFPDKRAMGFPFDRPSATSSNITDFILPNMALTDISIRLQNTTEPNSRNPTWCNSVRKELETMFRSQP